ncbi:MAG: hypothetical protein IJ496_04575 [Ruminococcus sp.]|nr:hypothetical protein [Ruminococcus sp.]
MAEKCINCGISNVPLVIGLDYQLHCEALVQMLVGAGQAAAEESEDVKEKTEEKEA